MHQYKVAIIGSGFCGTMVAANLVRLAPSMSVALIEKNVIAGPGLAYGTVDPDHLLNVRAGQMGAFADEPGHFLAWLYARSIGNYAPHDFVPRHIYGRYLKEILAQSCSANPGLEVLHSHIVKMKRVEQGFELESANGQVVKSQRVVLALGNFPPERSASGGDAINPYSPSVWEKLAEDGDVLIIGTGLTSLDLITTLAKTKRSGILHVLSRHGLFPREHTLNVQSHALALPCPYPDTALGLFMAMRREMAAAAHTPWQNVMEAFRSLNQQFWQSFSLDEKRRFLRHLRAYWDAHHYRCPPQAMEPYRKLQKAGRLVLHRGSVVKQVSSAGGTDVTWRRRGASLSETFRVNAVVRCTGPQADFSTLDDPLVQNLLEGNLIVADQLRLGVIANEYRACDTEGRAIDGVYVLGSLLKGKLYATVAAREQRGQAADLAQILAREID